jgi:hypothetical protein
VETPADLGPPSLTNPILEFPSGRLALSIESNKHYDDSSPWVQKVVYLYSTDQGQSWGNPTLICGDMTGRLMHWDQRAGVVPDGLLMTFTWTYDTQAGVYRNIDRRLSSEEGRSWSAPENLGFPDQPSHPAVFLDGGVVLAWVDRYETQSIRARLSTGAQAPFEQASEVVLHDASRRKTCGQFSGAGQAIDDMFLWNYGLPFAEALPNGEAMVVYYAPQGEGTAIYWARLER